MRLRVTALSVGVLASMLGCARDVRLADESNSGGDATCAVTTAPTFPGWNCTTDSNESCRRWAQSMVTRGTAYGTCSLGRCVGADRCTTPAGGSDWLPVCTCGDTHGECGGEFVCASEPGIATHCVRACMPSRPDGGPSGDASSGPCHWTPPPEFARDSVCGAAEIDRCRVWGESLVSAGTIVHAGCARVAFNASCWAGDWCLEEPGPMGWGGGCGCGNTMQACADGFVCITDPPGTPDRCVAACSQ